MTNLEDWRHAEWAGATPALLDSVQLRSYDTEAVAWSPQSSQPVYLDAVAALIAQLLDGSADLGTIADDVNAVLGVPESIARAQLGRVVTLLDEAALLEQSQPHTARHEPEVFPAPPNP